MGERLPAVLHQSDVELLHHHSLRFIDTAPTEIYTLSLHDALPILELGANRVLVDVLESLDTLEHLFGEEARDRKSTRLNFSHVEISYAVFCLKKKNTGGYWDGHGQPGRRSPGYGDAGHCLHSVVAV